MLYIFTGTKVVYTQVITKVCMLIQAYYDNVYKWIDLLNGTGHQRKLGDIFIEVKQTRKNKAGKEIGHHIAFKDCLPKDGEHLFPTRMLIEGGSWMGKSTICHQMCMEWKEKMPGSPFSHFVLVLMIPLRCLDVIFDSLIDLIEQAGLIANDELTPLEKSYLEEYLHFHPQKVCLVLDGFEELKTSLHNNVLDIWNGKQNRSMPVIMTSRQELLIDLQEGTTNGFHFELVGFDNAKKMRYIKAYYEASRSNDQTHSENNNIISPEQMISNVIESIPPKTMISNDAGSISPEQRLSNATENISPSIISNAIESTSQEEMVPNATKSISQKEMISNVGSISAEEVISNATKSTSQEEIISNATKSISQEEMISKATKSISPVQMISNANESISQEEMISNVGSISAEEVISNATESISPEQVILNATESICSEEMVSNGIESISPEQMISKASRNISQEEMISNAVGSISCEEIITCATESITREEMISKTIEVLVTTTDDVVKSLTENPLNLALMCITLEEKQGILPNTNTQIIQESVLYLVKQAEKHKHPDYHSNITCFHDLPGDIQANLQVLAQFAYERTLTPSFLFTTTDVAHLQHFGLITSMKCKTCKKRGKEWQFIQVSFQEFMGAYHFATNYRKLLKEKENINDMLSHNMQKFCCGIMRDNAAVLLQAKVMSDHCHRLTKCWLELFSQAWANCEDAEAQQRLHSNTCQQLAMLPDLSLHLHEMPDHLVMVFTKLVTTPTDHSLWRDTNSVSILAAHATRGGSTCAHRWTQLIESNPQYKEKGVVIASLLTIERGSVHLC